MAVACERLTDWRRAAIFEVIGPWRSSLQLLISCTVGFFVPLQILFGSLFYVRGEMDVLRLCVCASHVTTVLMTPFVEFGGILRSVFIFKEFLKFFCVLQ